MIALIDGDIVAYRCAASCEPSSTRPGRDPLEVSIWRTEKLMQDIVDDTGSNEYRCFLTGATNFRKDLTKDYKANRKDMKDPTWLADTKTYLIEKWNAEVTVGCEADDMMGVEQSKGLFENIGEYTSIICSIDKDLLQVPGRHYNFVKQEHSYVDSHQGWVNFFTQMIMGDKSDNIMGYDGKARVVVPQFLASDIATLSELSPEDMFQYVWDMYDDKDAFQLNYKLLWIWREENDPWNFLTENLGNT